MTKNRISKRRTNYMCGGALLVAGLTYLLLLGDRKMVTFFAGKEMVLETLSALLFLVSSIFLLAIYLRTRREPRRPSSLRRYVLFFLSTFFFVAFGEEISWGQHFFKFSTPESISRMNRQRELNIHNLDILDSVGSSGTRKKGFLFLLTANRLFDYFMLTLFIIIPAASRLLPSARRRFSGREIPVLPGLLSVALIFNLLLTAATEMWLVDGKFMHLAVSETREFNYSYLCLTAALYLFAEERDSESSQFRSPPTTTSGRQE